MVYERSTNSALEGLRNLVERCQHLVDNGAFLIQTDVTFQGQQRHAQKCKRCLDVCCLKAVYVLFGDTGRQTEFFEAMVQTAMETVHSLL